ncbi:unnamed protein product [Moneuplotes crassus]|uniref:Uncharacterized protein n=1 Tax=Euplotes crassus TaxID=5936 RepID=A0AAD2D3T6_EUPCR|nr:unnamed protein product [Moneuplotes crassus]
MEKTGSDLEPKPTGGKACKEYALQQQATKNYLNSLDRILGQYDHLIIRPKPSSCIIMFLGNPQGKQALSKIVKLAPQSDQATNTLLCHKFFKNRESMNSFYARNITRLLPVALDFIIIKGFRISQKDFGRVLTACGSSPEVKFSECRIIINGFGYLDNAHPSIGRISLNYNTIIQPEEDNEHLDGLIQKMADSSLNDSLRLVLVWTCNPIRRDKTIVTKREYKIGKFHVRIF